MQNARTASSMDAQHTAARAAPTSTPAMTGATMECKKEIERAFLEHGDKVMNADMSDNIKNVEDYMTSRDYGGEGAGAAVQDYLRQAGQGKGSAGEEGGKIVSFSPNTGNQGYAKAA